MRAYVQLSSQWAGMISALLSCIAAQTAAPMQSPEYIIELTHVATLRGTDETPIAGYPAWMSRAADGTIYLANRDAVHAFSTNGQLIRNIGRKGAGPGEYQLPRIVLAGSEGHLHILDPILNRHTVTTWEGKYVGSTPLNSTTPLLASAVLLPSGNLVTNMVRRDPQTAGYALQEIDRNGKLIASFDDGPYDDREPWRQARALFARHDGEIWSARSYEYTIDLFSSDHEKIRSIVRDPEWFRPLAPGEPPSGGVGAVPPSMEIRGIWEDSEGHLWTVVLVPSLRWKPSPEWRPGAPSSSTISQRFDTMIEVLDATTGRVIATRRADPMIVHALSGGYVASYRESSDGIPFIDVWRVSISPSQ